MGGITERQPGLREREATGVADIYPAPGAGGDYAKLGPLNERIPATDAEPRALCCAQCGQPIEDSSAIATCLSCGSDNFKGRVF